MSVSNWKDELADKTYDKAWDKLLNIMRSEFRKNKIKRIFGWE